MKEFKGKLPTYIGDAVYASFDGYHFWLSTSDGLMVTNEIALDSFVMDSLKSYVKYIYEMDREELRAKLNE